MRGGIAAACTLTYLRKCGEWRRRRRPPVRNIAVLALTLGAMLAVFTGTAATVAGCSRDEPAPIPSPASPVGALPRAVELPAPEVLAGLLGRLADPEVRGDDKLPLIEGATPQDGAILDRFIAALHDNHYLPLTFTPSDISWSDRVPGNAVATVEIRTAKKDSREFSFPLEFSPDREIWQLSRRSAEMLFEFAAPVPASDDTGPPTPAGTPARAPDGTPAPVPGGAPATAVTPAP